MLRLMLRRKLSLLYCTTRLYGGACYVQGVFVMDRACDKWIVVLSGVGVVNRSAMLVFVAIVSE